MKTNNIISPVRLLNMVKRDLRNNITTLLIVFGAVTAVIYIVSAITALNSAASGQLYFTFFTNILFVGGLIVTSIVFKEMHKKETAQNYLLLPASNFEKFLSRLLLSTVGFAVLALVGLSIISYLAEGINTLIFNRHNQIFNPFTKTVWVLIAHYFVAQSFFFLGAVYFRKYNFLKTINIIFLALIVISILGALLTRIIYFDMFEGFFKPKDISILIQWEKISINPKTIESMANIGKTLYWLIPAPLFWTISYFRIKEVEVKNAV